jgi:phosphoserine phosphatase
MHKLRSVFPALVLLAACGDDTTINPPPQPDAPEEPPPVNPFRHCPDGVEPAPLDTNLAWFGTNRADLTSWFDEAGCASEGYDPAHKPVAMFDWDNTISKNDFGDAITFYLVAEEKVLQPAGHNWKTTSGFMTDAAAAALELACGTTVADGQPLPTKTNTACADEILAAYTSTKAYATAPAFAGNNQRHIEATFAWTAQLMAGYSHTEMQGFMIDAVTPQLAAPENTTITVGTTTGLNGWLRIYDQSKDLIKAAQARGYDVWVITASPQDAIAAVAPMVGIAADHVIGIRSMTDGAGKMTSKFEGCGPIPDDNQQLMPFIQGKRCWINKVVYGDTSADAFERRPDGQRWHFAAGDSDTDIEFLKDATFKLVLNRNKKELMCHAYYNENDSWRINPMFIQPKAVLAAGYNCPVSACKDENGASTPCRDLGGNVIPVQVDSVH